MGLLNKGIQFCAAYENEGKANLGKGCWNLTRKLVVTTHFSEITKPKVGKKRGILLCIFKLC